MKLSMLNKLTIVNTFIPQTSHRNITHSVIITRKTIEKMEILKYREESAEEPKGATQIREFPLW